MAKYDHGGGCACGLSRFCDCSNATEQDRKDREAYDQQFKKEKPMAHKQTEVVYDQREDLHAARMPPFNGNGGIVRLDIVNKATIKVSTTVNGLEFSINVPMPAEISKAVERVLRAGCGQ